VLLDACIVQVRIGEILLVLHLFYLYLLLQSVFVFV
jgi:hypothetical protein